MLEKLLEIEKKYLAIKEQMMDPTICADVTKMASLAKEMKQMEKIYTLIVQYKTAFANLQEAEQVLENETDKDLIELAKQQLEEAKEKLEKLEYDIKIELLPKDENDEKNIYLEIRPAAGGDEAGLFASELLRCYLFYAQKQGWKTEIVEEQLSDIGGIKLAIVKISGENVYAKMKRESGVHRVQRVPVTESQGRVHTSTVTVAIMPEVDDIHIEINPDDVRIDTYAASSAGGQNANKNQTGVRLVHLPTGIIVDIGDSKSQLKNKEKARSVLKAKLYKIEQEKKEAELRALRGSQIGTGDRSEKIRTYNYPQDRVTDHRIKQSWSNISAIMAGELDDIINALILDHQTKLLALEGQNSK